ncbi:MAG: YdgA family protein [Neisseriaceae bacterium]|nr:YdgA family protein [Neisseriaceae bacterium]
MKKTPILLTALIAAAGAAYVGGAWYCGSVAEQTLDKRSRIIQGTSGLLQIVSRDYNRGIFVSTETLTIRVSPTHLASAGQFMPDRIKALLDSPITIKSRVRHNLWGAKADSSFEFSGEQQKMMKQLFGDTTPFTMTDNIALSGSGSLKFSVVPLDYEELSGIKIAWQGLQSTTDYEPLYTAYKTNLNNPGLAVSLADYFNVSYQGLKYQASSLPSQPIKTGDTDVSLQEISMHWNRDKVDYKIRLNEVVKLVSGLQLGGFINPSISILPPDVAAHNIHFAISSKIDNNYLSGKGLVSFERLNYGDEVYGPMKIEGSAEHLNATAFAAISDSVVSISNDNADEWRSEVLQTLRGKGAALFTDDPKITLSTFDLQTPSGKTQIDGSFALKGVQKEDLDDFSALLPKISMKFNYQVPQAMIESFAHTQIQNLFDVEDQKNAAEIQETVRLMMNNMIADMQKQGYLKIENGVLIGDIALNDGQLLFSGKPATSFEEEDDENIFEDEEISPENEPAQEVAQNNTENALSMP